MTLRWYAASSRLSVTRNAKRTLALRERFGAGKPTGLKALLASAPFDGIDLTRESDFGREVEL